MIEPALRWNAGGFGVTESRPARRMRLELVRWAEHDIDPAAIGFPARYRLPCEVTVGVCQTPVVFDFEFVFGSARSRIAPQPELLDKVLALRVALKQQERGALPVVNDIRDIFLDPLGVGRGLCLRCGPRSGHRCLPRGQRTGYGDGQNA